MTPTYLLFFIAPLVVAPPLTSPLLFSLWPSLAPGKCFKTWVLITYQFYQTSLFLRSFAPTNVSLPSIFSKLAGMTLPFTFDSHCSSAEKYSSLSFSSAAALFTSLTLNVLFTFWCSGQTALFLYLLAKAALAYLPTAFSVSLKLPFSFQQAQYAQVFLLKPAPSCKLSAGLGSTNNSATSLLLSDSPTVLASIFPFTSISLVDLAGTVFSLPLFYQATMSPWTFVFPGERRG